MAFKLLFTKQAGESFDTIDKTPFLLKRAKAIKKALSYLEQNPKHPSLNTHKYTSLIGKRGEDIFEAYAENNIPGAYRIF